MVSVLNEKLKGGSLVLGSEVGWRWVREVERATGCGRMEATLIICARNESCGKRVTLNVNRERGSV